MARTVRTARGEEVDFDTIIIKQQLAQAPMNIEVTRRKKFIDAQEAQARQRRPTVLAPAAVPPPAPEPTSFELDAGPPLTGLPPAEAIPVLPERPRRAKT